ncbi:MAG: DUF2971 domain-containing protein [Cupriavidus sp.]|uniref:DUF2971 domain-containing protein n=2 Tax=Cupriavidus TaxID=106589 RepID=UPI0005723D6D|nr:DUF2971 domain-containing protein [Cupriavidus sp.]
MLHHYTSVSTLELILRNGTLRFTRLDQFDDVTEGRSIGKFPLGTRLFASCWSADDSESVPQWEMYGDRMRGVRLSLPESPFVWHHHNFRWHENFAVDRLDAPFSIKEMLGAGIVISPTVNMRKTFGQRVKYVKDVESATRHLIDVGNVGEITLKGEGNELAFYKSETWAFQKEYRYVLVVTPGHPEPFNGDIDAYLAGRRAWGRSGIDFLTAIPDRLHIDLSLNPAAMLEAEIIVGPLATEETMARVESLGAELVPNARVTRSRLSGQIRRR